MPPPTQQQIREKVNAVNNIQLDYSDPDNMFPGGFLLYLGELLGDNKLKIISTDNQKDLTKAFINMIEKTTKSYLFYCKQTALLTELISPGDFASEINKSGETVTDSRVTEMLENNKFGEIVNLIIDNICTADTNTASDVLSKRVSKRVSKCMEEKRKSQQFGYWM